MKNTSIACATISTALANPIKNADSINKMVKDAAEMGVKLILFPELTLTGVSVGDVFSQKLIIEICKKELSNLIEFSKNYNILVIVGLPLELNGELYNSAVAYRKGKILSIKIKSNFSDENGHYQRRVFSDCDLNSDMHFELNSDMNIEEFGNKKIIFQNEIEKYIGRLKNTLIAVLAAFRESVYMRDNAKKNAIELSKNGNLVLLSSTGEGESSSEVLFSGLQIIAYDGEILKENDEDRFSGFIEEEFPGCELFFENDFESDEEESNLKDINLNDFIENNANKSDFSKEIGNNVYDKYPFIPREKCEKERILRTLALALSRRITQIHTKNVFLGVSGGLDSTLALLIAVRAYENLKIPFSGINCITMPGFGTSDRTRNNAWKLGKLFKTGFREIRLDDALIPHFKDIGIDENDISVAFENAQARERTQILMDLSNVYGGLVLGTGDMSEIALGWSTYNGDQMSMYAVNGCVPKTLARDLVMYEAGRLSGEIGDVLMDVVNTPVSPELLPPKGEGKAQETEKIIGPYDLHDFFLYHFLNEGITPEELFNRAVSTFECEWSRQEILSTMRIFYSRFFKNQFKRTAMPDGITVWDFSLSPRSGFMIPSDIDDSIWIEEVDELIKRG